LTRGGPQNRGLRAWDIRAVCWASVSELACARGSMDAALADIRGRLAAGECVYVHCWGGRGRAGTVGACALAALYGLPADAALARVQAAFDTRRDDGAAPRAWHRVKGG